MNILFDSKDPAYKQPFGTLTVGQPCVLHICVPEVSGAIGVTLMLEDSEGTVVAEYPFTLEAEGWPYCSWRCEFSRDVSGLHFYWFRVLKKDGSFRLFREGNGTNMEAGEKWQLSVIPEDFQVPDWARGAIMYQILPDRFYRSGRCDLMDKIKPFTIHDHWNEQPNYEPDEEGNWNNDFFGGNLAGITSKLPYLKELGVDVLYLNPIFMAFSSHRYDTADYKRIDPMLGTEADFRALCAEAHRRGMKVVLDGVFSHTGSKSIYFDADGTFGHGALSDPDSPYRDWYRFYEYPRSYDCWWGIDSLPCIEETRESYMDYIIRAEDSVVAKWMSLGADGFRLDVVDELPDEFVACLKQRIRQIKPDALLLGEVWEDASNKRTYGVSRRYFVDGELDSVMNYPWRKAIVAYVMGFDDGKAIGESIMTIAENYPPQVLECVMNLLGTHDTPRILTALVDTFKGDREAKSRRRLSPDARKLALKRLHMAAFLQFALPGMPCIYYGDEAGQEGFDDPFCRKTYPWGHEDLTLQNYYRALCRLKKQLPALKGGQVRVIEAGDGRLTFQRCGGGQIATIHVNQSYDNLFVPTEQLVFGERIAVHGDRTRLRPGGFCMTVRGDEAV